MSTLAWPDRRPARLQAFRCSALAVGILLSGGCDWNWDWERMQVQPHYRSYEANPHFQNGTTMQRPPAGTVAYGHARAGAENGRERSHAAAGTPGPYRSEIPIEVDRPFLRLGRSRFDRICAACHGLRGDGSSEVARHMRLRPPPSLHEPRIREMAPGRIFETITRGYGLMPSHAHQLDERSRWAVVAYVQVLQLSQRTRLSALPKDAEEAARSWLH